MGVWYIAQTPECSGGILRTHWLNPLPWPRNPFSTLLWGIQGIWCMVYPTQFQKWGMCTNSRRPDSQALGRYTRFFCSRPGFWALGASIVRHRKDSSSTPICYNGIPRWPHLIPDLFSKNLFFTTFLNTLYGRVMNRFFWWSQENLQNPIQKSGKMKCVKIAKIVYRSSAGPQSMKHFPFPPGVDSWTSTEISL